MCVRILRVWSLSVALLVVGLYAVPGSSETRPFSVEDLVSMERLSDPQVSPNGSRVVFVRRTTDLEANRGRTDLWIVGSDGFGLRQLTRHQANDANPRWSPDGSSIFFLSTRTESSQVWRIDPDGGEAAQITDHPLDVGNLVLSGDGSWMAFTAEVFPDCDSFVCTRERLDAAQTDPVSARVFDQLFVRHWDQWKDGRRSHLFVQRVGGGQARDLTSGIDADVPSKPFGGAEEITFTPDGSGVVFTMRDVGASEPWSTDFDLYYAPTDGSTRPRCLTEMNSAWDTGPVFSPDGSVLAYRAMEVPGYESDRFRIVVRSWPDGVSRTLTADWDRSADTIVFSPDGQTIFTTAADVGQVSLFAIDVDSGGVRELVDQGHVRSPAMAGNRIVYGYDTLTAPVDLYSVAVAGGRPTRLTEVNKERLAGVEMGQHEQYSFAGWKGETVYGYVVRPAGFDPDRQYPVAFVIHGGPQGSSGNDFHYRWNPQTYAGAGYATVMVDFHGSTGYGQEFTDSIRGDWGGKPLVDLQKGLAAALDRYDWLDGDRVCALGASYGGYMINWIAGNWPDRFQCLVNHDGVFDNRMMYYATEELWFPEREHGGPEWLDPEGFARHNPIDYVENWSTPMLVIQGELDYRIPVTQSLGTFTALQRKGIESRLIYFPDENHWVLKPANSVFWHQTVNEWLDRWLRSDP